MNLDFSLFGSRRVPFVAASELIECGLACLAAVGEFHRGELTLARLREMAMHSGRGETLLDLRNLAERMGLAARGVKVDLRALGALALPAILHWDMNHFVVLERITKTGVIIMDPAGGRMSLPWQEVHKSFTGVALELKLTERWRQRLARRRRVSVLDFVGPFAKWRPDLLLILTLSILLEVLVLLVPMQMQLSVDNAVQTADGRLVWILGIAFGLLAIAHAAIAVVRAWAVAVFGARVGFDLRDWFVRALHAKPATFFLRHHTADLLNRSRSADTIQGLVTAQLIQALLDATMSLAMIIIMFIVVPKLALVIVAFGLANVCATSALRHAAIDNSRRHLRAVAKADETFLENARAARAIKLFGKESVRISLWRNRFVDATNLALANARLNMFSTQAAQATGALSSVALITTATWLVINGALSLGTMMMFVIFQAIFVTRLNSCASYIMELRRVQTHAERIAEVMEPDHGPPEPFADQVPSPFAPGAQRQVAIKLCDVWFRYGSDSPWILKGVNLSIEAGESVAITGPSGCGKTTLMGVMLGLLAATRGEVLVNGRDLTTISASDYASIVGVVMQDDTLFQGTVADNIAFFDAPVNMVQVREAARKANIDGDITAMSMGYYSLLAEGASDISGGQKQRLFIARAIYHQPGVLFLDEATSHLDPSSERLVSEAVRSMRLTRVLIAHRKETIATADRVLVLDPVSGTVRPEVRGQG